MTTYLQHTDTCAPSLVAMETGSSVLLVEWVASAATLAILLMVLVAASLIAWLLYKARNLKLSRRRYADISNMVCLSN